MRPLFCFRAPFFTRTARAGLMLICRVFCCVGLAGFAIPLAAQPAAQAVILQYHHIGSTTPPVTSISVDDFRTHLEYLRRNDFQVKPLETVIDALRENGNLPARTAVITFDDGYASVYEEAFPLLKDYGWPFTIFVTAGLVDSDAGLYSSWDQLREMAAAGATLANHTVSHPYFLERREGQDDAAWLQAIEEEIVDAEAEIQRRTGQSHHLLAYPYGEYNPAIQALVERLGYVGIGQHSGPVNASSDFSALPRFPFSGIYASMNTFPVKVNSLAFDLQLVSPPDPVTATGAPAAVLDFNGDYRLDALTCYNNDTPIEITAEDTEAKVFRISTAVENHSRRFRYNCTAPGPEGRYYWYSVPWINPAVTE